MKINDYSKTIVAIALIVTISLIGFGTAFGYGSGGGSSAKKESSANIATLQNQVRTLMLQLLTLLQQRLRTLTPKVSGASVFERDLEVGSTGEDVRFLQRFLNDRDFQVAASGPGSPSNETAFFGALTRDALVRFQQANGISPAVGYFGPLTRGSISNQ